MNTAFKVLFILPAFLVIGACQSMDRAGVEPEPKTLQGRIDASDDLFPPIAWEDFYGTERSADISDNVRSFVIAFQVCHYFKNLDRQILSKAEKQYVDANISENCRYLSGLETELKKEHVDTPVALEAIAAVIASPQRPAKAWNDNFNHPRDAAIAEEVRPFIIKRQGCDHFRGEGGYNEERTKFLLARTKELCTGTDAELQRLRSKYAKQPQTMKALSEFEDCIEYDTPCPKEEAE